MAQKSDLPQPDEGRTTRIPAQRALGLRFARQRELLCIPRR